MKKDTGMAADESQKTKRGDREGKERMQTSIFFASLMDICHLKISELEPQFQEHKGRVVLRGDSEKIIQDLTQYLQSKVHLRHK